MKKASASGFRASSSIAATISLIAEAAGYTAVSHHQRWVAAEKPGVAAEGFFLIAAYNEIGCAATRQAILDAVAAIAVRQRGTSADVIDLAARL